MGPALCGLEVLCAKAGTAKHPKAIPVYMICFMRDMRNFSLLSIGEGEWIGLSKQKPLYNCLWICGVPQ